MNVICFQKKKFRENANIINVFTQKKGKISVELFTVEILEKKKLSCKYQLN